MRGESAQYPQHHHRPGEGKGNSGYIDEGSMAVGRTDTQNRVLCCCLRLYSANGRHDGTEEQSSSVHSPLQSNCRVTVSWDGGGALRTVRPAPTTCDASSLSSCTPSDSSAAEDDHQEDCSVHRRAL